MNEDKYNEISYTYLFVSSFKLVRVSLKKYSIFSRQKLWYGYFLLFCSRF